jgi:hypothetical protein
MGLAIILYFLFIVSLIAGPGSGNLFRDFFLTTSVQSQNFSCIVKIPAWSATYPLKCNP